MFAKVARLLCRSDPAGPAPLSVSSSLVAGGRPGPTQGNPTLWQAPDSGMRSGIFLLGLVFWLGALYDYLHGVAVPFRSVASGVDRGLFAR